MAIFCPFFGVGEGWVEKWGGMLVLWVGCADFVVKPMM